MQALERQSLETESAEEQRFTDGASILEVRHRNFQNLLLEGM